MKRGRPTVIRQCQWCHRNMGTAELKKHQPGCHQKLLKELLKKNRKG